MYKYIILLTALVCGISHGMDLVGTPIEQCINCICYARSGVWDIYQCGHRLMKFDYWENSGSLTTSSNLTQEVAFRRCKQDANCIINTIKRHTEQFGVLDCNLDGKFDCQDRFAIQHYNRDCMDRTFHHVVFNRLYSCLPNFIEAEVHEAENKGNRNQQVGVRVRQENTGNRNTPVGVRPVQDGNEAEYTGNRNRLVGGRPGQDGNEAESTGNRNRPVGATPGQNGNEVENTGNRNRPVGGRPGQDGNEAEYTGNRNTPVGGRARQDIQISVQQRTVVGDEVMINEKNIRRTNYN